MEKELQQYLDGEIGREDLTPESQLGADQFEQWSWAIGPSRRERAPAWLENRIMVSLPAQPPAPLSTRIASWLFEPRRIRIRPLPVGLAGALVLALAFAVPWQDETLPETDQIAAGTIVPVSSGAPVYVQFVFSAPQARSVAVSGDFNSWQQDGIALRDQDGDGVWTGLVPLRPGLHKYMFLVDGEEWVTDPRAERYVDDGFGGRNAVITVTPPPARAS